MYRHDTTKEGMIGTGFNNKNTISGGMGGDRRLGTRDGQIIKRTRRLDTRDHFLTQRTYHRVTIRDEILAILRASWEMQRMLRSTK
jgi:hypothetical protein